MDPKEDFTETFLCHARILRFAHRTGWRPLYVLSLYRLSHTLATSTLFEKRIEDITRLLRFGFDECEPMPGLQDVPRNYLVRNETFLMQDPVFREFKGESGFRVTVLRAPQEVRQAPGSTLEALMLLPST